MMDEPYKKPLNVLVAGGAGYIGSVTAAILIEAGHVVTVIDNLSHGYLDAVHPEAQFVRCDITDEDILEKTCSSDIDVVMHFAAFIEVGESVKNPSKYYVNNLTRSIRFFDNLIKFGIKKIVFSSTAAVYGNPVTVPLTEDAPLAPVNPYGWTKLMVETVLRDYNRAYGLKSVALRYFNAGGAMGDYGENHEPESHLIPLILDAAIKGTPLKVFGDDYDTRDGSCIRDYIHVRDIAQAHILAARYLCDGENDTCGGNAPCGSTAFNLGTGTGFTVLEVIRAVERVIGKKVPYIITGRREGDPPELVASPARAERILDWTGNRAGLEDIIRSAWEWKKKFPRGYER
ncbi:UDP-glucose 4-epimerase GalE [bacterium]|nr:UDP-glucose 4-epimerase GalE [bacterium]